MRELRHRLDAALTDVGRATAALADAEARAGEAQAEVDAARQELVAARAEAGAFQRRLASTKAAVEVIHRGIVLIQRREGKFISPLLTPTEL